MEASPPSPSYPEVERVEETETTITMSGSNMEDLVMSEVHLGCPPGVSGPHLTRFTYLIPPEVDSMDAIEDEAISPCKIVSEDEDGDLIVTRRTRLCGQFGGVTIRHSITSSIPRVGLQVWRAELVLADFVLHKMFLSPEFDGIISIELGSGTGLVGILLAFAAKIVFITDHGNDILDNCAKNIELNLGLFGRYSSVHVRELDWQEPWPPAYENNDGGKRYSWTSSEVEDANKASVLLAADVIYSDDLTDAFFCTIEKLMSQGSDKVLYLALEKRYNFSLHDLDVVANGYSHFRSYLRGEESEDVEDDSSSPRFVGRRVDLSTIPQYVQEYERGTDVELWQIKYVKSTTLQPPWKL
ncbi:hypothetical protein Dimus_027754 [Dionaea muscipula]